MVQAQSVAPSLIVNTNNAGGEPHHWNRPHHQRTATTMESYNLKTATAYINNLLLARGLLRNGTPIEFAHPSRGEGGKEVTMAQIINLVHDLILKRDVCAHHGSKHTKDSLLYSATRNTANPSPTRCAASAPNRRARLSPSRNFTRATPILRVNCP